MVKISILFTAVAAATTFGAVAAAPLTQSNAHVARQGLVGNIQAPTESPFGSIPSRIGRFLGELFGKRDLESLTPEEMIMLAAMLGDDESVNVARQLPPQLLRISSLFGKRDLVGNIQAPTESPFGSIPSRIGRFLGELFGKRDLESLTPEEMIILAAMLGDDESANVARQLPPELLRIWAVPTFPSSFPSTDLFGKRELVGDTQIEADFPFSSTPSKISQLIGELFAKRDLVGNIQAPTESPFGSIPSRIGRFLGELFGKRDLESITPEEMLILSAMLGDQPVNVARQEVVGNIQVQGESPFGGSVLSRIGKFFGEVLFGKRDLESITPEEMLLLSAMLGDQPVNVARQEVVGNIQVQGESPFGGSVLSRIGKFFGEVLFGKRDLESLTPEEVTMLSAILSQN